MKSLIAIIIVSILSTNTFARTCSYLADEGIQAGAFNWGQPEQKKLLEGAILNSFDQILEANETSCESIPVDYQCNNSDHCTTFCIASTVSEHGSHVNVVFETNRCEDNLEIKILSKAIAI